MDLAKEEQQRKEFRDILYSLAQSQDTLKERFARATMYKRLEALYYAPEKEDHFRHFYSDIFSVLWSIKQGHYTGDINVLGQNLLEIRKGYKAINYDTSNNLIDISDHIKKLYDHVSLDIARIGYSDAADWKLSQEESIIKLQEQVQTMETTLNAHQGQITEKLKNTEDDLQSAQKEHIAILGIFSSVVLTFTAGITFSTSVLQNLHTVSVYRIAFTTLLIGFVLINVLFGLFYYIDRLVHKKEERVIKPLLITNISLLVLIVAIGIGWFFGFVESRDTRIESKFQLSTEQNENDVKNEDSSPPASSAEIDTSTTASHEDDEQTLPDQENLPAIAN